MKKNLIIKKPTSSGQRGKINVLLSLTSGKVPKAAKKQLTTSLKRKGGRNNKGRLTVYTKGGGHKRRYRAVDFKRNTFTNGTVERIDYDPNRSALLALIKGENKQFSYILAPEGLKIGEKVGIGSNASISLGSAKKLKNLPIGALIHNIEGRPGEGGKYLRSAGSWGRLMSKTAKGVIVRFKSKALYMFPLESMASLGIVGNISHSSCKIGKAGSSRWMGRRPVVRGVAINPVDHPHGGGEGKTSGGKPSRSPWGWHTKGPKTSSKKRKKNIISLTYLKKRTA